MVLDFLSTTNVGRLVPAKDDVGSEVSERGHRGRKEERRVEAEPPAGRTEVPWVLLESGMITTPADAASYHDGSSTASSMTEPYRGSETTMWKFSGTMRIGYPEVVKVVEKWKAEVARNLPKLARYILYWSFSANRLPEKKTKRKAEVGGKLFNQVYILLLAVF